MKNTILKYGLLAIICMVYTLPALAGPIDPPTDDDPIDPMPINNWVPILFVAAISLSAYFLKKGEKLQSGN